MIIDPSPCPIIPGIAELFEKPLPQINFPKESEKKVYLYCELIQRNHKKNNEQDDKKQENTKKKTRQRKKKKKTSGVAVKQTSLKDLLDERTEPEPIDEDPTLVLPERKTTSTHKWPAKLATPKVEPVLKGFNSNDIVTTLKNNTVATPKNITATASNDKVKTNSICTDPSYDLLGSLLGNQKPCIDTQLPKSAEPGCHKTVGCDVSICIKKDVEGGSNNEGTKEMKSKILLTETNAILKKEISPPSRKSILSNSPKKVEVKNENQKKKVSKPTLEGINADVAPNNTFRTISKDPSCDLLDSLLSKQRPSSITKAPKSPESPESDSNEDLGYDLSICIENESVDVSIERTQDGSNNTPKDKIWRSQIKEETIDISSKRSPKKSKDKKEDQKGNQVDDLCSNSMLKPQTGNKKKPPTKKKTVRETSKGLLHAMKTLKKRTSNVVNKRTQLLQKYKSILETSEDVDTNEAEESSNGTLPLVDACNKKCVQKTSVSNTDSKDTVSSSTTNISEHDQHNSVHLKKCSSTDVHNEHGIENDKKDSNIIFSFHDNSSQGAVERAEGNHTITGKRTSSPPDQIIAKQHGKRSRKHSNELSKNISEEDNVLNEVNAPDVKNNKTVLSTVKDVEGEEKVLEVRERKRKLPVKRSLVVSDKINHNLPAQICMDLSKKTSSSPEETIADQQRKQGRRHCTDINSSVSEEDNVFNEVTTSLVKKDKDPNGEEEVLQIHERKRKLPVKRSMITSENINQNPPAQKCKDKITNIEGSFYEQAHTDVSNQWSDNLPGKYRNHFDGRHQGESIERGGKIYDMRVRDNNQQYHMNRIIHTEERTQSYPNEEDTQNHPNQERTRNDPNEEHSRSHRNEERTRNHPNEERTRNRSNEGYSRNNSNEGRTRNHPNMQRGTGRRNTRSMSRQCKQQYYEGSQNWPESSKMLDLVTGTPMGTDVVQSSSETRRRDGNNNRNRNRGAKKREANREYWAKRELGMQREREKREYDAQQPCVYYKTHGKCKFGDECRYSHDIEVDAKMECCKYYVAGACIKGDDCQFIHGDWPCKFYHMMGHCNSTNCRFSHEEMTPKMKEVFEARMQYEESLNAEKAAEKAAEQTETKYEAPCDDMYGGQFPNDCNPVTSIETKSEENVETPNEIVTEAPKKIEEFQFPSLYYELT